ncbi:MAG TPA: isoprenylcysteine carboxylmethyltransferase family protein [Saprospiraceae bacterium]|nr:isoprenylcysteine carboxylmethyltransferase family protein [Saprospiraceae bacterium]HMQ81705.1 isoprenylcysteine carboxylmethyltransferase family protein [Saprospiraceae bacterium]
MDKWINTAVFLLLGYLLPCVGKPQMLSDFRLWLLMLACVVVFFTQPGFKRQEAKVHEAEDKASVWLILLLSLIAIIVPILEWRFFHFEQLNYPAVGVGLLIILAGIGMRVWAINTLGKFFTATVNIQSQHRLVTHGPYQLVRHPSYLGAFMAFIGSAVVLESWYGLIFSIIAMLLAYRYRISQEEKALINAFGSEYRTFQQNTKKMIPYIW